MDYWAKIIERKFTKIGSYYWWCENDEPHTLQPTIPEEYGNSIQNLEYELDDDIDMLNIERIWDKLSAKYDRTNTWSNLN